MMTRLFYLLFCFISIEALAVSMPSGSVTTSTDRIRTADGISCESGKVHSTMNAGFADSAYDNDDMNGSRVIDENIAWVSVSIPLTFGDSKMESYCLRLAQMEAERKSLELEQLREEIRMLRELNGLGGGVAFE